MAEKVSFKIDWEKDVLEEQPSRPLKHLPTGGGVVEITTRTLHGLFTLKPGTRANDLILGVLGRALHVFPRVRLHGFVFLSNHYNLMASFPDVFVMAAFMNHVNSCIARELGVLYDWREKFFGRRYRGIVVTDEESQVERLAYLLAQGTKEGLVARPDQWPGAKCFDALTSGTKLKGKWVDRTALYRARQRDPGAREKDFVVEYDIPLYPLPCWENVPEEERQRRTRQIIEAIEEKARELNARLRRKPMGAEKILKQNPHDRPGKIAKSPAPLCHASSRRRFWKYANVYFDFVARYRAASKELRDGDLSAVDRFPPGCFLPAFRPPGTPSPLAA